MSEINDFNRLEFSHLSDVSKFVRQEEKKKSSCHVLEVDGLREVPCPPVPEFTDFS